MGKIIDCSFSLLDTQRKYTGTHRKYIIENARNICYSPVTREKISKREAYGFYGHGRRVLCGRPSLEVQEVDVITLPDGKQAMVSNIPSNVTIKFEIDESGTVTHSQEILDTETGRIVDGLNASKVGGFSWACPGKDGGTKTATLLTGFSGFDYVLSPGFSANRGYILEAANRNMVLESVSAIIGDDKRAEQLVAGWQFEGDNLADLEDAVFESRNQYYELKGQNEALETKLATLEAQNNSAQDALKAINAKYEGILARVLDSLPIFIPDDIMHDLLDGDFTRARNIFESAARMDFSQYPLGKNATSAINLPGQNECPDSPEYGSSAYGFGLIL